MTTRAPTTEAVDTSKSARGLLPSRPMRVWLLTNAPSPYQCELLTSIAAHHEVDLSVRFMRSSSTSGQSPMRDFDAVVMRGLLPESCRDEVRLHPRALYDAAFGRYDAYVLSGLYTSVTFLLCAAILRLRGIPQILWLEQPRRPFSAEEDRSSSVVTRLRDGVRKRLLGSAARVIGIGSAARDAYHKLGSPLEKIDVLPYCCDLQRYDDVHVNETQQFRTTHDLTGKCTFLFSGQLIERKGVDTLLQAFSNLDDDSAVLLILGDGPQRASLESSIAEHLRHRVRFLGHLPQEQLPVVFRSADVFVFPSRDDGWGVVINEACAASLPIITTWQTGAAHDLVEPEKNGFRLEANDIEGFRSAMHTLLNNPTLRQSMGRRSRVLVETLSPDRGAERFAASLQKAVQTRYGRDVRG